MVTDASPSGMERARPKTAVKKQVKLFAPRLHNRASHHVRLSVLPDEIGVHGLLQIHLHF